MKNFFSVNKTSDREARDFDANPYLAAHVSAEVRAKLDNAFSMDEEDTRPAEPTAEEAALKQKSRHTWWLCAGCLLGALALVFVGVRTGLYDQMPYLHIVDLGLLVLAIVFNFKARKLTRKQSDFDTQKLNLDFTAAAKRLEEAAAEAARELGVPEGAETVDILPLHYKIAGNKTVRVGKKGRFDNLSVSAFVENGALCLATAQELYRIPLGEVVGYRTYDEEYEIDMWLKPEEIDSDKYKSYGIRKSGFLACRSKTYYGVEVAGVAGSYEILVPAYDFDVLRGLVPLTALA